MKEIHVPADISPCDEIALLLEGFWENQSFRLGQPSPAYRAMTGFLLGIRLRERFGAEAVRNSRLCPITLFEAPYEAKILSNWSLQAHVCFAQVGYHAMEALMTIFNELYRRIDEIMVLRMVDGTVLPVDEWAKTGVGLALWFDDVGRIKQMREACLKEALQAQDWLTVGLASVDIWWEEAQPTGIPERADVTAAILCAPYKHTELERLVMTKLLTEIKLEGYADEWGGDIHSAVLFAFHIGRTLAAKDEVMGMNLLAQDAKSKGQSVKADLAGLRELFKQYTQSGDPATWESTIADAAKAFTNKTVRIPYLPGFARAPSVVRAAVDFGFWGGVVAWAVGEGVA